MAKSIFDNCTNKYNLSKTLRFELKPVGKTLDYVKEIISQDEKRDIEYKKAKKIIDQYHKIFIENILIKVELDNKLLQKIYKIYLQLKNNKNDQNLKKEYISLQDKLRKNIFDNIKESSDFKILFSKEFIDGYKEEVVDENGKKKKVDKNSKIVSWLESLKTEKVAPQWLLREGLQSIDDAIEVIKSFKGWTTYFGGFNENRKNIYTNDPISTSIPYRIIHDNLPKFMENVYKWKLLKKYPGLNFSKINSELKSELVFKVIDHQTGEITKKQFNIEEVFDISSFNYYLNQEGIEKFNVIIGGKFVEQQKEKIKGVNEYINLFSQQQNDTKIRTYKMNSLFKQILSDRNSFIIDKFENDAEVVLAIKSFYQQIFLEKITIDNESKSIKKWLMEILKNIKSKNLENIYLKKDTLTDLSKDIYHDWQFIGNALESYIQKQVSQKLNDKGKPLTVKQQAKLCDSWLESKYFSIAEIQSAIELYLGNNYENSGKFSAEDISDYFIKCEVEVDRKRNNVFDLISNQYLVAKDTLNKKYFQEGEKTKELIKPNSEQEVEKIKNFLDSINCLLHFLKPLDTQINKKNDDTLNVVEKDSDFYTVFDICYQRLSDIIHLYNKVRNYITQKPYSVEKYKINFENSTLADGWDHNKEKDNYAVLFIKDDNYYLGIMNKNFRNVFSDENLKVNSKPGYQKIVYKLLPGPSKMLPKVFFSKENINYYDPDKEILRIRNYSTHTKNGSPQEGYAKKDFNLADCHKMIDFFKESIAKHPEWGIFNFKFSPTKQYESIDSFYHEVEEQGYKISFQNISEDYLNSLVSEGKFYLFQIYNKDFSNYSKGNPNLHTLYWRALFDKNNLKKVVYKLNGEAEIFYRKSSLKKKITHPKNKPIKNKNSHNTKNESLFKYDLIKDKRYTEDKLFFHCPITMNFAKPATPKNFNLAINNLLKKNINSVHILSIDRGERHLAYYTLLDPQGKIKKQGSFNVISNKTKQGVEIQQDYHDKLDQVEKSKDLSRKSWKKIANIKELKVGYLSQVVHQIVKMVVDYNAIVVFEDLNFGFKKGRFKVEKQVYQKLEKMLIDKLNYTVFKKNSFDQPGGLLKAYQLAAPFESFKKMGKQTGIIFYVPAYHTSKIDPTTGFVNLLYPKYTSKKLAQDFFGRFDEIKYNRKKDYFEFKFDYQKFTNKDCGKKTQWTVCSYGKRLNSFRNPEKNNQWDIQELDTSLKLKELFKKEAIDYAQEINLVETIKNSNSVNLLKELVFYLKMILQMRNSRAGTTEDYLISPVANSKGEFFDSRNAKEYLPQDADANGAYHIGLKGLMLLDNIKKWKEKDKLDLSISNSDWYNFVQNR